MGTQRALAALAFACGLATGASFAGGETPRHDVGRDADEPYAAFHAGQVGDFYTDPCEDADQAWPDPDVDGVDA